MAADGTFKLGYDLTQLEADGHRAQLMAQQHGAQIAKQHATAAASARMHFREFGKELIGFAGVPLTVIGAAEGLRRMAEHFSDISDKAKMLDTTPEAVQRLGFIAAGTNGNLDSMASGLLAVQRGLMEVNNEAKQRALQNIGIDAASFFRLDADKAFIQLARSFQTAERDGKGLTELFDILKKSAPELLPALRTDAAELEEFARRAVVSAATVEMFEKNLAKLKMTGMSAMNFTAQFSSDFSDFLKNMGAGMAGMFSGEGFAEAVNRAEKAMSDAREKAARDDEEKRAERKKKELERMAVLEGYKTEEREESKYKAARGAAFGDMGAAEKLKDVKQEIYELSQKIATEEGRIGEDADFKLRKELELIALKREQIDLQKQARKQAEATSNTEEDVRIMELKASHRNKAAENMEKNLKMQKDFQQLRDAHPEKTEAWAMDMARRRRDAQDKIDRPGVIHGFKGPSGADHFGRVGPFAALDAMHARGQIPWNQLHPGPALLQIREKAAPSKEAEGLTELARHTAHLRKIEILLEEK